MGVHGQRHVLAALLPGKIRYPLYRRLDGPQGQSGRVWKNLAPTGIQSPDRPARSVSLYRLSYPGPAFCVERLISVNNREVAPVNLRISSLTLLDRFFWNFETVI
jgi:hypothetical protein